MTTDLYSRAFAALAFPILDRLNGTTIAPKLAALLAAERLDPAEIQRRRDQIDCDPSVKRIIVTLHLQSGSGHPRSIECTVQHEERLLDSCGAFEKVLDNGKARRY